MVRAASLDAGIFPGQFKKDLDFPGILFVLFQWLTPTLPEIYRDRIMRFGKIRTLRKALKAKYASSSTRECVNRGWNGTGGSLHRVHSSDMRLQVRCV